MRKINFKIVLIIIAAILITGLIIILINNRVNNDEDSISTINSSLKASKIKIQGDCGNIVFKLNDNDLTEYIYNHLPINFYIYSEEEKFVFQLENELSTDIFLDNDTLITSTRPGTLAYDSKNNSIIIYQTSTKLLDNNSIYDLGVIIEGKEIIEKVETISSIEKY